MKKPMLIAGAVILSLIVLVHSGIFDSLLIFLLVGAIPGTSYSVPSTLMLLILISLMWLVVFRLTIFDALQAKRQSGDKKSAPPQKKRLPRRRYSHI